MSRIGKQPVPIPSGVSVTVNGRVIVVAGPKGELQATLHPSVTVVIQDGIVVVSVRRPDRPDERALWGLWRNLIRNMIVGVTSGFSKTLEIIGVGYKAAVSGQTITLNLGFSHPVSMELPNGVVASLDKNILTVSGCDKQAIGQVAANIRHLRPPEPYKGKGIKYSGEIIRRKAGKAVKAVGK